MFYRLAAIVFIFISTETLCQNIGNSSFFTSPQDSSRRFDIQKIDSIQISGVLEYALLKKSYDSISHSTEYQVNKLNQQIDSLQNSKLPTAKAIAQRDSIIRIAHGKLTGITDKVDQLKSDAKDKLSSLKLPPDGSGRVEDLTSLMEKIDVSFPAIDLPSFQDKLNVDATINYPKFNEGLPDLDVPDVTRANGLDNINELGQYQDQIPTNIEEAVATAEEKAMAIDAIQDVQKELGEAEEILSVASSQDQEAVKAQLQEQVQQQAMDHFAGKEEQLQQAMETLAKYKHKYGSLESLSEIPKRRSNEMRDKPLIERMMPGVSLQIFRKDNWMVDFNPYVGYRFNTRLTIGLGWNQRIVYDPDLDQFNSETCIYGPRSYGEFKLSEGFSAHLQVEYMNTLIPPLFSSGNVDQNGREWVFSTLAGMKKEYRFFKNIKGTLYLLYNLYDPHHKSPYADRLNMRIGFEFPMKRKPKPITSTVDG